MMRFVRPRLRLRLRKPAGIALFGTVYAAAWLIHGGNGWQWARQRRGCAVRFPD